MNRILRHKSIWMIILLIASSAYSQKAYFVDGFHGGVYGHYPKGFTQYIDSTFRSQPDWAICLEIEPATWCAVQKKDPQGYSDFIKLYASTDRIEYCNPGVAQSYLYNTSGESNIRQFTFGIKETRKHFPDLRFHTYSVEEPCFTSSLPAILRSLGVSYAVLKNPNTCWGGYTAAYGGELVNWVGPDGTKITTVPRYACEELDTDTTWRTAAANASWDYIQACFRAGIRHPAGMTFQDAGWRRGPWPFVEYSPIEFTTWTNYIENISIGTTDDDWHFSQEDVLVSIMWGSQILQKIAQQVKSAENNIIQAEKMASINKVNFSDYPWPSEKINNAWENLLLSQHHDCWIVPYNLKRGKSWADFVKEWTDVTNSNSKQIIEQTAGFFPEETKEDAYFTVFNTLGVPNTGVVTFPLPSGINTNNASIVNEKGEGIPSQIIFKNNSPAVKEIVFNAMAPATGYSTYSLQKNMPAEQENGVYVAIQENGDYRLESDHYRIIIDPSAGGVIKHLIVKKLGDKDFVDSRSSRKFNEIRGYFSAEKRFISNTEQPATIEILEEGPVRAIVAVNGIIASTPFTQTITLIQGEARIDLGIRIDWKENTDIGKPTDKTPRDYRTGNKRPFYNDRYKLLALFPASLKSPKLYKNAPFDVCESKLSNTFFGTWDSIKHNIILDWVDIYDPTENLGLALFSDHTTTYTHGETHPLGLNLQYSGGGLWGRYYVINRELNVNYALIPHTGNWKDARLETERTRWNEPLIAISNNEGPNAVASLSAINVENTGLEVVSMVYEGSELLVRLYNAEGDSGDKQIQLGFRPSKAELIELNGEVIKQLAVNKPTADTSAIQLNIQQHGIRTLRFVIHE